MGTVSVGTVPEMAELDKVNIADIEGEYRRNRRERWRAEAQIAANPERWHDERANGQYVRRDLGQRDKCRQDLEMMPSYGTGPPEWRS